MLSISKNDLIELSGTADNTCDPGHADEKTNTVWRTSIATAIFTWPDNVIAHTDDHRYLIWSSI